MDKINGKWSTIEISGKAADIFEPARPDPRNLTVLHLHGHGLTTLKDNAAYSAEFERYGLRAICPHGRRSWWGRRICREFDPALTPEQSLREQVMPFIATRWSSRPPAVALMGISMGGQGVLRLAYRYPREFPIVAALSPAVDFQRWHGRGLPLDEMYPTAESARQETATLEVHPLNWPRHQLITCDPLDEEWFDSAERLISKLYSTGIPYESDLTTSRGGHTWDYFNHIAPLVVKFLAERLEREVSNSSG